DGFVGVSAKPTEHRKDLVLIDQGTRGLDGLGRVERIVLDLVIDPAAVYTTVLVDVVEDGTGSGGHVSKPRGGGAGQGLRGADASGVGGDTLGVCRGVALLGSVGSGRGGRTRDGQGRRRRSQWA